MWDGRHLTAVLSTFLLPEGSGVTPVIIVVINDGADTLEWNSNGDLHHVMVLK